MVVAALLGGTAAVAVASIVAAAISWRRQHSSRIAGDKTQQSLITLSNAVREPADDCADAKQQLDEVGKRSKSVLYIVSNKTNDAFSIPNLTKYMRMKGISVHDGATPEETIAVNAKRLLEHLDASSKNPSTGMLRHELVQEVIPRSRLEGLFPTMKEAYVQQPLDYGRNSRYGDKWRISCYLVVMENWKPKIQPHEPMVQCMNGVMNDCVSEFAKWRCKMRDLASVDVSVMNAFVTRYRPTQDEDQLQKHIDGANVDGSVVLALPTDDPFEGGKLHVWDGKPQHEFEYQMASGDVLFLDNAVWHQAKPIMSGTRWALVLFLRLGNPVPLGRK